MQGLKPVERRRTVDRTYKYIIHEQNEVSDSCVPPGYLKKRAGYCYTGRWDFISFFLIL